MHQPYRPLKQEGTPDHAESAKRFLLTRCQFSRTLQSLTLASEHFNLLLDPLEERQEGSVFHY
ncbi:hypothetical protein GCM10022290_25150 [Sagittula marina]